MEFSRPEYWSGQPFPSPGDLPNPGIKPGSPELRMDSLPAEPQEKPKSTGVGSLSLLQWISPTQESNGGLLHCRLILHQLSHQGNPILYIVVSICLSPTPNLSLLPFPFGNPEFVFYVCGYISVLYISSFVSFF